MFYDTLIHYQNLTQKRRQVKIITTRGRVPKLSHHDAQTLFHKKTKKKKKKKTKGCVRGKERNVGGPVVKKIDEQRKRKGVSLVW